MKSLDEILLEAYLNGNGIGDVKEAKSQIKEYFKSILLDAIPKETNGQDDRDFGFDSGVEESREAIVKRIEEV